MTFLQAATQMFKSLAKRVVAARRNNVAPRQRTLDRRPARQAQQGFGVYAAFFLRSSMRQTKGVKIICMASSILPPGTTMVLARLMKLPSIMLRR